MNRHAWQPARSTSWSTQKHINACRSWWKTLYQCVCMCVWYHVPGKPLHWLQQASGVATAMQEASGSNGNREGRRAALSESMAWQNTVREWWASVYGH